MGRRPSAFYTFSKPVAEAARSSDVNVGTSRPTTLRAEDATISLSLAAFGQNAELYWFWVSHQPQVVIREKPSTKGRVVAVAQFNEFLEAASVQDSWARLSVRELEKRQLVEDCGKGGAWALIDGRSVGLGTLLSPCLPRWFRVEVEPHIILRSAPGGKSMEVGKLQTGVVIEVTATTNGWVQLANDFGVRASGIRGDSKFTGLAWAKVDASDYGIALLMPCSSIEGRSIFEHCDFVESPIPIDSTKTNPFIPISTSKAMSTTLRDNVVASSKGPEPCREPLCFVTPCTLWSTEIPEMRFRQVWSVPSAGLVRHEFNMRMQPNSFSDIRTEKSIQITSPRHDKSQENPNAVYNHSMCESPISQKRYAEDGLLYSRQEFIEHYGEHAGQQKWSNAEAPAQRRYAGDGQPYSQQEFIQHFGQDEGATFWEQSLDEKVYAMISFQIVSTLKRWRWRIHPVCMEKTPLVEGRRIHDVLVPGVPDAIMPELRTPDTHDDESDEDGADFCIVEPIGSVIKICVEISCEESCADLPPGERDLDAPRGSKKKDVGEGMQFKVWYEHSSAGQVSCFEGCDPENPPKTLVAHALRQQSFFAS